MVVVTKPKPDNGTAAIVERASGIQLDIGCGAAKQPGYVGMDIRDLPGVDIVHNVLDYPWPLDDDIVIRALASHLVEHIPPHNFGFIRFMNEVWRVCKPGGEFIISTPHGRSEGYLQDPTHCNPCNQATWMYFDPYGQRGDRREEDLTEDERRQVRDNSLWSIYQPKPWRIKILNWDPSANMEVLLVKRSLDEIK